MAGRLMSATVGVTLVVMMQGPGRAIGHLLGGRDPSARTASAVTTAARNPGLALLVATRNDAPQGVTTAIPGCLIVSPVVLLPDTAWRGRLEGWGAPAAPPGGR